VSWHCLHKGLSPQWAYVLSLASFPTPNGSSVVRVNT